MKQLRLVNPSIYYKTWLNQPVKLIKRMREHDGDCVDVELIGDIDRGLRLRVSASAVKEVD